MADRCTSEASAPYEPMVGTATEEQVCAAYEEFERRVANGERDIRVLVARQVPMEWWTDCYAFKLCRVEGVHSADGATVNIVAVGMNRSPHGTVDIAIGCEMANYDRSKRKPGKLGDLRWGAWYQTVTLPDGSRVDRKPEGGMTPALSVDDERPTALRVIFEVSDVEQTLGVAQRRCREFFCDAPYLRAALLVKFIDRRPTGATKCVAVVYERDQDNEVVVADVVGFGSAPLDEGDLAVLERMDRPETEGSSMRELPLAPLFRRRLPPISSWCEADHATIEIRPEHLYYRALARCTGCPIEVRPDPLSIDLWEVFDAFESSQPTLEEVA